jgi:nitrate/nitrite transporter NarK
MLLFRWAIFLLLLLAMACFIFFVGTGDPRYKRWGLKLLSWTLIAAGGFFAVLILERLA